MKKARPAAAFAFLFLFSLSASASGSDWPAGPDRSLVDGIKARFAHQVPREWGQQVSGVRSRLDTTERVIALTLDACGGAYSLGYDAQLINFLEKERVPATLFVSGPWIDVNPQIFQQLAHNPLFEIENHGMYHKPCSTTGRSAFDIQGTASVEEVVGEIEGNARRIERLTGKKPKFYRSGTGYCDEVGVAIAHALGYEVVNFTVLGDAGATYSRKGVELALLSAPAQSIVILHMNHPEGETAEGLMDAIPELKRRGFRFVQLRDCALQ